MPTPNIGLNTPIVGTNFWGGPLNYNFSQLDLFLSGLLPIPGLKVQGDVVVTGTITAGSFLGLGGAAFLTTANYNQPNGVAQLDASGKIPNALLQSSGIVVMPYATNVVFNAALGNSFKLSLGGDVVASTFVNGSQGKAVVVFRFVQDATGGHNFTWPSNVRNAGHPNPAPNSVSVQAFALDTDGGLDAIGPIMYS